jgi:hypothetical protein
VAHFDVVVDQARVAGSGVEALSHVFKENPHEHCADRETNYSQTIGRLRVAGGLDWSQTCRHHQPPSQTCLKLRDQY